MATPPTFVADYEGASWSTTTTPKTTGTFDGSLGDALAAVLLDANDNGAEAYTFSSSPAETWTEQTETAGTTNADSWAQTATTILTAARTGMTVSAARTAGDSVPFNIAVLHFTGSDGIGASARSPGNGGTQPSLSITTQFANSAIVVGLVDWAATAGARTYRQVNAADPTEVAYFTNGADYTCCVAYYADAGAAGSQTVGITAPATGDWLAIAVEVRGVSGPPPEGPANSDAMQFMGKSYY